MEKYPRPLIDLKDEYDGAIDLFICSASYEERCKSVAKHLNLDSIKNVLIAKNFAYLDMVENNYLELSSLFASKNSLLAIDSNNPIKTADEIINKLSPYGSSEKSQHVVIDVSTFTHESLLILFAIGRYIFRSNDTIDFIYSTASDYSIGDNPDNTWLSKGVKEVRSVLGYPGNLVPSRKTHLVILGGHEEYRAYGLIKELEPSLITIGYGDRLEESTAPHQTTNEKKVERLRSLVGDVISFEFSCYDPLLTEKKIGEILRNINGSYNTIIAPMNTKISTLGAALYSIKNQEVQLCYAQPEIYNYKKYSKPGKDYFKYCFDDYVSKNSKNGLL